MENNYNGSQVGVPYVRVNSLTIVYPPEGTTRVHLAQALAMKGADGQVYEVGAIDSISAELDLVANGTDPIPLVSPEDGSALGADTTLQQVFVAILAVVRQIQNQQQE